MWILILTGEQQSPELRQQRQTKVQFPAFSKTEGVEAGSLQAYRKNCRITWEAK